MSLKNLVAVVMGSQSDWETMCHTADTLKTLEIPYQAQVVSAHRTPDLLFNFANTARENGIEIIIAGAGGAAHLPGMLASKSSLPILGVPIQSKALNGVDSLLSIVQMPPGIPVGTMAIGRAGAINAALLAASILSLKYEYILQNLEQFRSQQTESVLANTKVEQ
jgi:5-(carboxyamino)imidazole ribonucleotide mutase